MSFVTDRRTFLRTGALAAGALALGPGFWRDAFAAEPATPGAGPYGPLQPADANGVELPAGFRSRIVARANLPVENTTYVWHQFPDGQATYATPDGGWILVSNSEIPDVFPGQGGASAIRFDAEGEVVDAYRILRGTTNNCSGGPTPWGTWLSCEETDRGLVWECDPLGAKPQKAHPPMGAFDHEAACVDPQRRRVYLSEDQSSGGFYRYTPRRWPDLSAGRLEIAERRADGTVAWHRVPDPAATTVQCRDQVPAATRFKRGEGLWFDSSVVYLATTGDNTVWAYDAGAETMEKLYDGDALGDAAPLLNVDNVTVERRSGDLYVCEDPGEIGMGIITPDRVAARFLRVSGPGHRVPEGPPEDVQNEITGAVFDPSGTRLYFAAQRSFVFGVIFEITGPFR
jgi:secreted PhoX family phosphatase